MVEAKCGVALRHSTLPPEFNGKCEMACFNTRFCLNCRVRNSEAEFIFDYLCSLLLGIINELSYKI